MGSPSGKRLVRMTSMVWVASLSASSANLGSITEKSRAITREASIDSIVLTRDNDGVIVELNDMSRMSSPFDVIVHERPRMPGISMWAIVRMVSARAVRLFRVSNGGISTDLVAIKLLSADPAQTDRITELIESEKFVVIN